MIEVITCIGVIEGCQNPMESYGEICVECNKCGRFTKGGDAKMKYQDSSNPYMQQSPDNGADLISRQDAIDAIENTDAEITAEEWDELTNAIKSLPSADRPKGEWIDHREDGYVECPFCGKATNCDDNKDELHFCWNCGSDLRREEDD